MDTFLSVLVNAAIGLVDIATAPIPVLADSGLLLVAFAAAWLLFGITLARQPARLDAAWLRLRRLPLLVQLVAWVLFLPLVAGAWIWHTGWPRMARLMLVAGVAGWNLVMFVPRPA